MYLGICTVQILKALGHLPGAARGWEIILEGLPSVRSASGMAAPGGMSQGLQERYYLILYSIMSVDNDAATASKEYIGIEKKPPDFSRGFC